MLPSPPAPNDQKGNIGKKKPTTDIQTETDRRTDGQTHITLALVHTFQCQGLNECREEKSSADVVIKQGDKTD